MTPTDTSKDWKIFRGDGTQHHGLKDLPAPPPWRFSRHTKDLARPKDSDQKGSPEHAEQERDRRRQQQRNHAPTAAVRTSATRSSPTARLALTSTASPEPRHTSSSPASGAS